MFVHQRYAGNNTQQAPAVQHVSNFFLSLVRYSSSLSEQVPKEDATVTRSPRSNNALQADLVHRQTYYDLAIAGERVIAPAHEKASSRLQQDPPIIFNYRNQVGIPLGVLHFNRNVPLQGRGCAPFPTASAGANITIKGYVRRI